MKFKNFTQAYFLIKNNPTYAHSLAARAQSAVFGGVIGFLLFNGFMTTRIPARDSI